MTSIVLPRFNEDELNNGVIYVHSSSLKKYKEAIECFGLYWCRELDYSPPYRTEDHYENCEGFLFRNPHDLNVVGGGCFSKNQTVMKDKTQKLVWWLDWVWIHPFFRHKGYLSRAWPTFKNVYGNFIVQRPYSKPMECFLKKVGHIPT